MLPYLEHANLTVSNIDAAVAFLTTALPELRVRGGGGTGKDRWVHLGTDRSYLALGERDAAAGAATERPNVRVNHRGFVVESVAAVKERLLAAGYHEGYKVADHRFRKRLYFVDPDGMEWEFVEYLSDDPAEQNDYGE